MATFNDLKFKKHPLSKGWAGFHIFENGYRISVTCGETMYCTPKSNLPNPGDYTSFEVAVLDDDSVFVTKNLVTNTPDDIIGWVSREQITELMQHIETIEKE
jgi:hypothetical protein